MKVKEGDDVRGKRETHHDDEADPSTS